MHLDIHETTTAPQIAAPQDRTIGIGPLRAPDDETELGLRTVLGEPFVAALPFAHPLAARRTVRLAQLAGSPFVPLPRTVGPAPHDRIGERP